MLFTHSVIEKATFVCRQASAANAQGMVNC